MSCFTMKPTPSVLTPDKFLAGLRERVLVFDGAMGSNLLAMNLTADDYAGAEGCSEALLFKRADAIRTIHASFLQAGSRAVETNTFGATRIVLTEYGLADKVAELNFRAVQTAREAIASVPGDGSPRYIAGSIGPTTRLPSLGQIGFAAMRDAYYEQVEALWAAGADILLIETCQDLLQTKAALAATRRVFADKKVRLPVMVSLTLEATGTMLVGSDIGAINAVLAPYDIVDIIGINCATGPLEMVRHIEHLAAHCPKPIACQPNAGLPEIVDGKAHYRLSPAELAKHHRHFVENLGIAIVGGCCGTTPGHLAAVAKEVGTLKPRVRAPKLPAGAASLYHAVSFKQEPAPCLVGERTNANGSKQFRELLLANDWDGMVALGKDQARGGAHLLDLCCAFVGRPERDDMATLVPQFARQVKLPLLIDSTEPEVIEVALQAHGGRCVINSVNLEDGGARLRQVARLARDYGAALIALTIDEQGMARTAHAKLAVAKRIYDILIGEFGLTAEDLIFDPLTFTVGSGDATLRDAALETLAGLRLIKDELPGCHTLLGVSNISFGLNPEARQVLNSVFLAQAIAAGLDLAIVHPTGILPIFKIDPQHRALAEALLANQPGDGAALANYMAAFGGAVRPKRETAGTDPARTLHLKVLDGDKTGLDKLIDQLLPQKKPLAIINDILIAAMREVGDLFGSGQMQLPFVLQSAETMKAAVALLQPHMPKAEADPTRQIILATVRGDVHDIGKNLVDILLSNNGFTVVNLGIKIDIDQVVKEAQQRGTDIIGLSGLLVKSTLAMKEYLEELNRRGLKYRVLLGGAALTRGFVENDLRKMYNGEVYYCADAFDGLKVMQQLTDGRRARQDPPIGARPAPPADATAGTPIEIRLTARHHEVTAPAVAPAANIPTPPFLGAKTVQFSLDQVLPFIDLPYLFKIQWGYRRGALSTEQYDRLMKDEVEPAFEQWTARARARADLFQLQARYGYWRCRRDGNELVLTDAKGGEATRFSFPRRIAAPRLCLSDYFAADRDDTVALFAVTVGAKASTEAGKLHADGNYRDYPHLHGLSVSLAETVAEALHARIRQELGLTDLPPVADDPAKKPRPRGNRYAFGYPVAPDLAPQRRLLDLLDAASIGITTTESHLMVPEQSTAGLVVHHPEASYFTMD